MSHNSEIDNYLSEIYSDEITPDLYADEITWIDELGEFNSFRESVEKVRAQLAENGDHYSFEQVESALRFWLEETVSSLIKDAPDQVMRGMDSSSFYSALQKKAPHPTVAPIRKGDEYTGQTAFKPEALREMILYYASKPFGVLKTKLNKLLWYADFLHYRLHGVSISGTTYIHLPFGPVPDQYEKHLSTLIEQHALDVELKDIAGFQGANLSSLRHPVTEHLPGSAVAILEAVYGRLGTTTSTEVSKLSHEEDAYKNTRPGERISYEYASRLKLKTGIGSGRPSRK